MTTNYAIDWSPFLTSFVIPFVVTAIGLTPGTRFTFSCSGAYAGTVNYRIEH